MFSAEIKDEIKMYKVYKMYFGAYRAYLYIDLI